ncbi:MAG: helix-turn-helix domain-containing protein [Syntrophorhabdaceae bacterium]|nr:helix-turn-helix domain-containing protein [Syntrophorhabdaceae bacterium]
MEQGYLTVKEVAQYLGMKTSTVYALVPEIPHYRIGNLIRFRKEDIDVWMATKREESKMRQTGTTRTKTLPIIDDIVRKTIDAAKSGSYNSSGKSDHVKDLRKEVKNGNI